ncbi:unnamed protein product [Aphanomyces euteiches]|nr:hypothetical protein AeRB84_003085 [Aphanomyces euteiches]
MQAAAPADMSSDPPDRPPLADEHTLVESLEVHPRHRSSMLQLAPKMKIRLQPSLKHIRRRAMAQPTMRVIMRCIDELNTNSSSDKQLQTRPMPSKLPTTRSAVYKPAPMISTSSLRATSRFRLCWDLYTMVLLIYTSIAVPFEIAFATQDSVDALFVFDRCVDLSFFIDMVFNFFTPYWDPAMNLLVEEIHLIAKHYVQGWFLLDLASILPFDIIGLFVDDTFRNLAIFRILRVLRVVKLVRVFRASRIFTRWQAEVSIPVAFFKLASHLATILLLSHWLGCLWGGMVHFEQYFDASGNPLSWMTVYGIDGEGTQTQYITSLYWAVVTILTIGYGDVPVVTVQEKGIAIVCMIVGCGTYSLSTFSPANDPCSRSLSLSKVIGSVCGVLSSLDEATTDFRHNMDHLNTLMQKENIPKEMVITLREYFLHTQDLMNHKYFSRVLDTLSPGLKGQLGVYTSGEWIHRVPFFQGGPPAEHMRFVTAITQHLTPTLFPPNESMISKGDLTDRMYILSKGIVARLGKVIGKGNFVGEDVILSNGIRHYEVRTLTFVDAMVLTRASLNEVLRSHFPHKKWKIRRASILLSIARKMEYFLEELKFLRALPQFDWTPHEESVWFRARMFNENDLELVTAPLGLAVRCTSNAEKTLHAAALVDPSLKKRDDFYAIMTCVKTGLTMLQDCSSRSSPSLT